MDKIINYYTQSRPDVASFVPLNIKTILDIGCSQGAFLKLIKGQTGAETWGIELVPEIAEQAKASVDHLIIGKVEEVINSIPDNHFDCISFNDVLEHLHEPAEVLKMIKPKLSKTGIIVASIPNVRHFYTLYDLVIKKDWEYKERGILDSTHFRFFTQKSMKRMFESLDFKISRQVGINEIVTRKFRFFNLITCRFFEDTKYLQFVCIVSNNENV